ncbi:type IV pilus modification protein PilV [Lysobacter sp. A286]
MSRKPNYRSKSRMVGVGLIEVLIAVLIMAIGMLGIAALQATALRNSQSSLERSQAVIFSYAILDAMRANLEAVGVGAYDQAMTCDAPAAGGTLASNDLHDWVTALDASLGQSACGQVACNPVNDSQHCVVTVRWNDSRGNEGEAEHEVVTESVI